MSLEACLEAIEAADVMFTCARQRVRYAPWLSPQIKKLGKPAKSNCLGRLSGRSSAVGLAMAKRLIPLLDRVLVEKIVAPSKSSGGILLPESAAGKVLQSSHLPSEGCGSLECNGASFPICAGARGQSGRGRWRKKESSRRSHSTCSQRGRLCAFARVWWHAIEA